MDEADRDIEMEEDPFLAAGIDIPEELPYKEQPSKATKVIAGIKETISPKEDEGGPDGVDKEKKDHVIMWCNLCCLLSDISDF